MDVNRKSSVDGERKVGKETTDPNLLLRDGNREGDHYLRLKFMLP